jgi:hypothetical protein
MLLGFANVLFLRQNSFWVKRKYQNRQRTLGEQIYLIAGLLLSYSKHTDFLLKMRFRMLKTDFKSIFLYILYRKVCLSKTFIIALHHKK